MKRRRGLSCRSLAIALPVVSLWLIGCSGCAGERETVPQTNVGDVAATPPAEEPTSAAEKPSSPGDQQQAALKLTSSAFGPGEPIPRKYTGDGENVSPPLAWTGLPEGTKELALICDDPDAPSPRRPAPKPWVHWVLYKIPPTVTELPEGIPPKAQLDNPPGALQGKNSWPTVGYRGPEPPRGSGRHRYVFKLYALDEPLSLPPEANKQALLAAMKGHILAEAQLIGTYER